MDSSTLAIPRQASSSVDKIGSSVPDKMDRMVDLESGEIHELNPPVRGMCQYPRNPKLCCIYRVPNCLRQVSPEAYTPQQVLIGPLHHSLKIEARKYGGGSTHEKSLGYLNMEARKRTYLNEFAARFKGENIIDEFRRKIEEEEDNIRASYSESTIWIQSTEFVEMILLDSVFIFQYIWKWFETPQDEKTGDPLMDEPCREITVRRDLMLLENQLPYFILEELAESTLIGLVDFSGRRRQRTTHVATPQGFRALIIEYFGFCGKIRSNSSFSHFTDLFRRVRVETLPNHITTKNKWEKFKRGKHKVIDQMYNADKLNSGGVKFSLNNKNNKNNKCFFKKKYKNNKNSLKKEELSLYVRFEKGCLKMPCLKVDGELEMTLRNVMALEQRHYPFEAHICNYVIFLDYLIDTDKDVDLLVEKGIIKNHIGQHSLVAKMVNKLREGILDHGSYYSDIAVAVTAHYSDPVNRTRAALKSDLKSVYFSSLLKGTGTVAAMLLLIMTLIQTVASIIQVMQNAR